MTSQVGRIDVEQQHITDIFKDVFKYAPSKLCGMLGNALIVPIYTSLLSPEEYGLYSISIALLSFLCILFSLLIREDPVIEILCCFRHSTLDTSEMLLILSVSVNLCFFFNEYFDWKKNLSFSSVKSYFQILPLIKFTNILKMAQFLYGSIILRNINVMLHFVTFSLGVEHSYMANGTFWDF